MSDVDVLDDDADIGEAFKDVETQLRNILV